MISLGSRAHIFAPPHLRAELTWCFGTVLGCGDAAPGGQVFSVEATSPQGTGGTGA